VLRVEVSDDFFRYRHLALLQEQVGLASIPSGWAVEVSRCAGYRVLHQALEYEPPVEFHPSIDHLLQVIRTALWREHCDDL
jgi:hypothetical protein